MKVAFPHRFFLFLPMRSSGILNGPEPRAEMNNEMASSCPGVGTSRLFRRKE